MVLTIDGGGASKRKASGISKVEVNKEDTIQTIKAELGDDIDRLEKTFVPNVIVDTATHIRQFVQQMEMTPETIVKDLLFKVSLPNLTKLLETASTNNLSHKTGALSKVVFENDLKNVVSLTSRVQLCEKA